VEITLETPEPEKPEPEKPPKSFKLLIIIGVAVVLLAVGVAAAWLLFLVPQSSEQSSVGERIKHLWASEKKSSGTGSNSQGHIYKMEPFLVNLADPGQPRYLKITLHVESNQEKGNEEYEKRLPQLRDAILTILSSKNYNDIMSSEGKTSLREEIKSKMNQLLIGLKMQNIYFTEFVVQ
jgi:flagellar FliL protein